MKSLAEIEKIYTMAMKFDEGNGKEFKKYYNKDNPLGYKLHQNSTYILKIVKGLVSKDEKILEIGGCTGRLAFQIAWAGYNIVSTDCVSEAINLANAYKSDFPDKVQKHVAFEHQFVESLSYKDNSFNCIIISEVLEHLEDLERGVKEIFRVLNRNGLFIFTVPYKDRIKSRQGLHIHSFDMESLAKIIKPYVRELTQTLLFDEELQTYSNIYGLARKAVVSLL